MNPPRAFWVVFVAAWSVFAVMALGNPAVSVAGAVPGGILDHQAAGSAERVAAIHAAWRSEGGWLAAQLLIALDFVFIVLAGAAAVIGGRALLGGGLRALGGLALVGGVLAGGLDMVETGAQALQVWGPGPSDQLAGLAKACIEPKLAAYVVAHGALLAGLVLRRLKN